MADIVAKADSVMQGLIETDKWGNKGIGLKTNQIRKYLSAVNSISNKVAVYKASNPGVADLSDDLANEVQFLQVMMVYQIGRERSDKKGKYMGPIEKFEKAAGINQQIKGIGKSIKKFEEFSKYMEALVAYHKFYGGKD